MRTIFLFAFLQTSLLLTASPKRFTAMIPDRLPVKMIDTSHKPAGIPVTVISVRHFKTDKEYAIRRGLHPNLCLQSFSAYESGDTAYVVPHLSVLHAIRAAELPGHLLVYVDGHGKTFDQVIKRGFELAQRYNIGIVIFDWPTDYLALRKTANNAAEAAAAFVNAMNLLHTSLGSLTDKPSVSAIFHSMGNQLLMQAVKQGLVKEMPGELFQNIVLNAASVPQRNHARWIERLNFQKQVYITMNDEDRPLRGAMLLRMSRQLGLGHSGRLASNAVYINFSQVATIEHNLFTGKSEAEKNNGMIFTFYETAFHGMQFVSQKSSKVTGNSREISFLPRQVSPLPPFPNRGSISFAGPYSF